MRITKVEIQVRTPTIQYGYINSKYEIEVEKDIPEAIEVFIQYVLSMNDSAVRAYLASDETEKKDETIPF